MIAANSLLHYTSLRVVYRTVLFWLVSKLLFVL